MAKPTVPTVVFVDLTEGRELVINRFVHGGYFGSQHVITLGTNRIGVDSKGHKQEQCAIVARLRFDQDMAKMLRDALNDGINALTPPADVKAN